MFKNIFNDLKLNRISYLLEVIENDTFKKKVDAFNKLSKIKLNEEMGHLILDKVSSLKHKKDDNFNIEISLISLIFNDYYDSYANHLFEIYKKLNTETKYEILNILSTSNEPSEIVLYRILIANYYKELDNFPIGSIASDRANYELVFPELYEIFKSNNNRNSLLLLLSDFVNQGVVPIVHLNKNKKNLQKLIINIFKEGIKYKINPNDNFMSNKDYVDLRIFLEVAINIEYYISSKETRSYLDKLYKTKDNQLKLFILENYARKEMDLAKININSIAKDSLSRYPLYSFLTYNKLENLMPKKYRNNKDLSLSDTYLNYCISSGYSKVPYDFELLEERIINDFKYYIYKFKTEFNYKEEIIDPATDYLLKNIKIDKELIDHGETTYIGISGGFSNTKDVSVIEKPINSIKIAKLDGSIKKTIDELIKDIDIKEKPEKEEPIVKTQKKEIIEEKPEKISKIAKIINFSRILTFVCLCIILLFVVLVLYISNIDLFNLKKNSTINKANIIHAVLLKPKDLFVEIKFNEIYNREESEYYVLFFRKKDKSTYYEYLNVLLKKDYKIYYVDISKKDNKPIFEGNETGFVINGDTLLKVKDGEYSFYIIGKPNIINEFKSYTDEIKKKEEEEKKIKEKEKQEKLKIEEKKKKKKE